MSEHLIWNRETERITSDEFVRIRTEEQYITGYGLDSDQRFEDYTLKKIKGTLSLGDD
jgi:hypoxanthine-guanine phosphoribosyltransferase